VPTHSLLISVVHERITLLDQPPRKVLNLVKVIARVDDLVPADAEHLQVSLKGRLELVLLLFRVGIVESEDKLALVLVGKESVEDTSLDVTDMEVTRGFGSCDQTARVLVKGYRADRRATSRLTESDDDLALDGIRQFSLNRTRLLGLGLGGLCL